MRAALGDCSRFCSSVKILSTIDFPRLPPQLAPDTHKTGPPGAIFKMLLRHTDTQTQTHRHTNTDKETHKHTDTLGAILKRILLCTAPPSEKASKLFDKRESEP